MSKDDGERGKPAPAPGFDPPGPDETPDNLEEGHGWASIAEWTGGLQPEAIPELGDMRGLEYVYPLLRALVGRSIREFFVRAGALKAIVASDKAFLGREELNRVLFWLDERSRDATVRALRSYGWLEYEAASGTFVTEAGRWAYEVLSFLHKRLGEGEFRPTVAGIGYSLAIGADPLWLLSSLRSRLLLLREEIETARASHSEVLIRAAAVKLQAAIQLSREIREVLEKIPYENRGARRAARDIHDLLSRLHGSGATLHAAVTEIGRQYLELSGGLTVEQIVGALMRRSRAELADVGRQALLPMLKPPPLLTTDAVAYDAEQQALRDRPVITKTAWIEAPEAARETGAGELPPEVAALLRDLVELARSGEACRFDEIIPRGSPGESFLRGSLLTLVGDRRAGEGVSGQLGALALDVVPEGDGWPEPIAEGPLAALTPGSVAPRKEGHDGRDGRDGREGRDE